MDLLAFLLVSSFELLAWNVKKNVKKFILIYLYPHALAFSLYNFFFVVFFSISSFCKIDGHPDDSYSGEE